MFAGLFSGFPPRFPFFRSSPSVVARTITAFRIGHVFRRLPVRVAKPARQAIKAAREGSTDLVRAALERGLAVLVVRARAQVVRRARTAKRAAWVATVALPRIRAA